MILRILLLVICALVLAKNAVCTDETIRSTIVGCYSDVHYKYAVKPKNLNHSMCMDHCKKKNRVYAVLEQGSDCACINEIREQNNKMAPTCTACNISCLGNTDEMCGGPTCATIIKIKDDGPINLGCFSNVMYESRSEITNNAECIAKCNSTGSTYAALNNGLYCSCMNQISTKEITTINTADPPTEHVKVVNAARCSSCNIPCAGNESEICGGAEDKCSTVIKLKELYVGCYYFVSHFEKVQWWIIKKPCIEHCKNRPSKYAMIKPYVGKDSYGCMCANQLPSSNAADSKCDVACNSYPGQTCGGIDAQRTYWSMYSTT